MQISHLDHFVLTVRDLKKTCEFYRLVLGMEIVTFGEGRKALKFGRQKINLHQIDGHFEPIAANSIPGSSDFCLIATTPLNEVIERCEKYGVEIVLGIVERTGANGKINSIYIRDPDNNLIEIANQIAIPS